MPSSTATSAGERTMSQHNHPHHAVHAVKAVAEMPALAEKKNPVLAGVLGLFFGAIGVGLYFKSWSDFFVCFAVFFVLLVAIPGLGAIPGWWFAAGYGVFRAVSSNQKL
jgi:hypothetical protein